MLLQEQKTDSSETSLNGVGRVSSERDTKTASVASVDAPQNAAAQDAGVSHFSRNVKREEPEAVTEKLLAEVRELRVKANQDNVMTKRKVFDRTVWVFFAGMLGSGGIALVLVYTNYLMYFKAQQMNIQLYEAEHQAALSQNQLQEMQATNQSNAAIARNMILNWEYPHAAVRYVSYDGATNWTTMTTKQSFAAVCDYYGRLARAPLSNTPQSARRKIANSGEPFMMSGNDGVHTVAASGTVNSNVTPNTATYTRQTDMYYMVATVSEGADNTTIINLTSQKAMK